jgi:diaminopimelate decarboxylase
MTLTRQAFGQVSKHPRVALNTRAPLVPTTIVNEIEGCPVTELIRQFGSPLFVVSDTGLRKEFRDFRKAFRTVYPKTDVAYSYKTNYLSAVCDILHQEGAWAEVVSGLEYEMARRLGIPGNRIIFNGPCKSDEEIRRAIHDGAMINLDNFDELQMVEEIAREGRKVPTVGIRVTTAVTEMPWEKFGFSLEAGFAEEACQRLIASGALRLGGLHVHLGTDLPDPAAYRNLLDRLLPFMEKLEKRDGVRWKVLDIGGGLPNRHRYAGSRPGVMLEDVFPSFAEAIARPLGSALDRLQSRPRLILEPGRAVVDHAVSLLTTVVAVKRLPSGAKAAILDAGVNLLPSAYYSTLDIAPTEPGPLSVEEVTLFGPLCMQVDCLGTGVRLPPLRRGSHLAVKNCGAYTQSHSMQFIQPRPPVILASDGQAEIIREKECVEDFLMRDRLPALNRRAVASGS